MDCDAARRGERALDPVSSLLTQEPASGGLLRSSVQTPAPSRGTAWACRSPDAAGTSPGRGLACSHTSAPCSGWMAMPRVAGRRRRGWAFSWLDAWVSRLSECGRVDESLAAGCVGLRRCASRREGSGSGVFPPHSGARLRRAPAFVGPDTGALSRNRLGPQKRGWPEASPREGVAHSHASASL